MGLALLVPGGCAVGSTPRAGAPRRGDAESGVETSSSGLERGAAVEREAAGAPGEPDGRRLVDGFLATSYRARFGAGQDDHDVHATLGLDLGDRKEDPVTFHLLGRALLDIGAEDGTSPVFFSLADTYDEPLTALLDRAYLDVHAVEELSRLRLGRQLLFETPELVRFDGLHVETAPVTDGELVAGVYGGVPAHLYESSPSGDLVLGAYVEGRPWPGGRLRTDWLHLEDENLLGPHRDELWALGLWQRLGERLDVESSYSQVESEPRDVQVSARWLDAEEDLTAGLTLYRLFETQRDLAVPLDPFYAALLELHPYDQVGLDAAKGLGRRLRLAGGLDLRRVRDEGDVGEFNRDFERYHLTATLTETLPVVLSVTADLWVSDGNDIRTWGADATREWEDWRASLGSHYSLFKYDLFVGEERDNVRSYYLRCSRTVGDVKVDLRYELEDSDLGDLHRLTVGATWRF